MALSNLFDIQELRELCESFTELTGSTTAILDLEGNIIVASGWQDICTRFHRVNKQTASHCLESDRELAGQIKAGESYTIYTCRNGLVDVAAPIRIDDTHVATFFTGQFFLAPPDKDFFIRQAEEYGFDRTAYLEALSKVPVISEERVRSMMKFYTRLTKLIGGMGLAKQRLEAINLAEELRLSEQRWKFALDGAGDGLWDWNAQTNKVYFSPQWKAMLGFDEHEINDSLDEWDKRLHPDDRDRVYAELNRHLDGLSTVYASEHRIQCKDGTYKWILDRGQVITRTPEGKPLRIIGTHTDLSALKRAENLITIQRDLNSVLSSSINLSEALQRVLDASLLMEGIDCGGIYLTDPRSDYLALAVHAGLSPRFVQAVALMSIDTPLVRMAREGTPLHERYEVIQEAIGIPPGLETLRSVTITPILHDGSVLAVLNLGSHTHEAIPADTLKAIDDLARSVGGAIVRIHAEMALRESQENLQILFDSMDDMLFIIDEEELRILKTNPQVHRAVGYTEAELSTMQILDLLKSDERSATAATLAEIIDGKISVSHNTLQTKDGAYMLVETKISLGTWDGRKVIFGLSRDITERRRTEERRIELDRRIQHAQKLESLEILAGGVAHDFNNLLMAMLGNMDLTLMELVPSSRSHALISKAMTAARRAAELTTQMLTYSGKGRSVVKSMDLSELVRENANFFKTVIPKTVSLNLALTIECALVEADPNQVQQILMNLITNAAEAIGEQTGLITVTTGVGYFDEQFLSRSRLVEKLAPGRYVYMDVSDTGCGMDESTRQRLFDPFFSSKFTGRGLGMSAVMGIVRAHKGAIFVDSIIGQGTTIRVLFPALTVIDSPDDLNSSQTRGGLATGTSTGTILVVDDEPEVREICREYVQHLGFKVITAADGWEAVQLFREHFNEIVCVLLDMMMPILDGLGTVQELKKERADIPVILCSGYNALEATRRFSSQGLAGFIQKPFRQKDLKEVIERVLPLDK